MVLTILMLLFGEIERLLATIYDRLRIVGKEDIETRISQTGLFRFGWPVFTPHPCGEPWGGRASRPRI